MWDFYEYWCKFHGVSRDRPEMERRFKFFTDTARSVHNYNSRASGSGRSSMTEWADLSREEKRRIIGGRK
jgi:hypothetical protein